VDRSEVLLAVAQVALGLAGFGGVFVALSREEHGERRPANAYRMVLLQSSALSTLLLSLLPLGFESLGLADAAIWALSSALMALLVGTISLVAIRLRRRHGEEIRAGEQRQVAILTGVTAFLTVAAQLANALGLFGARAFGVFLCGLIYLVAFGSYLFARMLFLWR
jgi:uncharacterized membrane protein YecN with MAPEG domain